MGLFSRSHHPDPEILADIPLFAGLEPSEVAEVAHMAERREIKAGETLIEQGRFGDSFYVIAEGQAAVYIGADYATTVGEGSAVGEMALVERRPRNATVIAETDMVVAEFGIDKFRKLLDRYPTANLRINELLNRRLRENIERGE
jgi:CRP-like cAMP-binding protein